MPSSGGSVSDAPVNKVVNGQSHYLAYITPDEGSMLKQAGGSGELTSEGIPSYFRAGSQHAGSDVDKGGKPGNGKTGNGDKPGMLSTPQQQAEQFAGRTTSSDKGQTKTSKIKDWFDATLVGKTVSKLADVSTAVQKKAMTWGINSRLKNIQKKSDFHPGAYGYKISNLNKDLAGIEAGTFTQKDFTEKYGSGDTGGDTKGNGGRDFTTYITPYAAHSIGGTTQQPSMAAQWYANMGGSQGGFNLTTQYAAAKAIVAKRLGSTSAVGQLAVNKSSFYNFLKDNSLDKGIL